MFKLNKNMTLEEYINYYLETEAIYKYSPVTFTKNQSIINKRIIPNLGKVKLCKLSLVVVKDFFNNQSSSQTLFLYQKNHGIGQGTLKRVKATLSAILNSAYQIGLIDNNPCRLIKLEYKNLNNLNNTSQKIKYYDKETYLKVINLIKNEDIEKRIIINLALKAGLRKSEVFGLTWQDVDFKNETISINKTRQYLKEKGLFVKETKNVSSIRNITIGKTLIKLLKDYKTQIKPSKTDFIIINENFYGISEWFKRWQNKNNISVIRFHDLRHTHATLLLSLGVDIKTISQRLGHSSIVTTLNIYTHVLQSLDKSASTKLDKLEIKKE